MSGREKLQFDLEQNIKIRDIIFLSDDEVKRDICVKEETEK